MTDQTKEIFVTHIGRVTVNDRGTVAFDANVFDRVICHADTVYELAREVRAAMRELRRTP